MPIPPHRAPGDVGHIDDHNDMADELTEHDQRITDNASDLANHIVAPDPHGDRAYADASFSPVGHTHATAVQSVNGQTGVVTLSAADVGAVSTGVMGLANGVATLDSGGKVPSAQLPPGSGGGSGEGSLDWENVKDYGATGDGSTDDTTEILAAIAAAQSGSRKRAVYFPYGTYKMSQAIVLADGLTLYGETGHGKEFDRRVVISNTTTDMFVYGGTGPGDSSQRPKDMVFQGITFAGDQGNAFITPSAIDASGAYPLDLTITYCGIKNFTQVFSGPALRMKLTDCYLNNCTDTILNIGGSDNHIDRNFIDTYIPGSQSGKAIVNLTCEETSFAENYVTCAPAMGITVGSHSAGLRIINNTINGLAQSASHGGYTASQGPGIYLGSGAKGVMVIGNSILNVCTAPWTSGSNTYDGAITVRDAFDITIQGNVLKNVVHASSYHVAIHQATGTVDRIKVQGNVYMDGSATTTPRLSKTGTYTNVLIDDETPIGGGTASPRPALAVVYASGFPSGWRSPLDSMTFLCDGTGDQTEINAAINAVAAQGGGDVYLAGYQFNLSGSVLMKSGVLLRGGGMMTELRASSGFGGGLIQLADVNVHMTTVRDLFLNGSGNNCHGILFDNTGGDFGGKPTSSPDAGHVIENLFIRAAGNASFAGHGIIMRGTNCRANKLSTIRILDCRGCGVWVDGAPDSHYSNIEVGASGTGGPAVSWSTSAPVGHGFFVEAGNNMIVNCKAYYCRGDGFVALSHRTQYANCQAQDNYGYGFEVSGRVSLVGCHADSNGQATGTGGLGTAGFHFTATGVSAQGLMSFSRGGLSWTQQYGFSFTSGCTYSLISGVTYDNGTASVLGTPGTGTVTQIIGDSTGD